MALEQRVAGDTPRGSVLQDITSHINDLRQLVESSDDFSGLEFELVQAYGLLFKFQKLNFKVSEVLDLVDTLESVGEVANDG